MIIMGKDMKKQSRVTIKLNFVISKTKTNFACENLKLTSIG